jgi:type VI protein secretion system component Hcp
MIRDIVVMMVENADAMCGSVKYDGYSRGIRLLEFPEVQTINSAESSHSIGIRPNNGECLPITVRTHYDKSVPKGLEAMVKGTNLKKITIYHLVSTGGDSLTLNRYVELADVYLIKYSLHYFDAFNHESPQGGIATYTFKFDEFQSVSNVFDDQMQEQGQTGYSVNNTKRITDNVGG